MSFHPFIQALAASPFTWLAVAVFLAAAIADKGRKL